MTLEQFLKAKEAMNQGEVTWWPCGLNPRKTLLSAAWFIRQNWHDDPAYSAILAELSNSYALVVFE